MQNSYLISYGTCNFLGRFVLRDGEATFQRGDRVVVQSERGREIGTVLTRTDELALPVSLRHIPGEIISRAELVDESRAQGLAEKSAAAFTQARALIDNLALPLEIIDVEAIGEPEAYAIHFVRYGEAASQFVQDTLSELYKKPVLLHDLTDPGSEAKKSEPSCGGHGCDGGGCSSKGGCANGTCGSGCGSSKEFPEQWKAYFAALRQQMEEKTNRSISVE